MPRINPASVWNNSDKHLKEEMLYIIHLHINATFQEYHHNVLVYRQIHVFINVENNAPFCSPARAINRTSYHQLMNKEHRLPVHIALDFCLYIYRRYSLVSFIKRMHRTLN